MAAPAAFDIAIGRCESIDGATVVVELDTAMVSRLVPGHPWQRSGTSKLRLPVGLCSLSRPPTPGQETFLRSDAILGRSIGQLDLGGDGRYQPVRLRPLADHTDPQIVAPATKEPWAERPSRKWSR